MNHQKIRIMKRKSLLILLASLLMLFCSANVFAGTEGELIESAGVNSICGNSKVPPQYPGGYEALITYLIHHVKYPPEAFKKKIEGKVIVTFVVEKDGSITNVKVKSAVHPALDAEAVRVVKSMPKWKPGTENGKAVRVNYVLPITFKLD